MALPCDCWSARFGLLLVLLFTAGADYGLVAPAKTMLDSCKPVVAVCAVSS